MNDNTVVIFKGLLFAILLFAVYKVLQKFGIFPDAKDRSRDKLMEDKDGTLKPLDVKDIKAHKKSLFPNNQTAIDIASQIYQAKGYIYDTDSQALSAIKKIDNKMQLKQVSEAFSLLYKLDLANYLDFMSKENMQIAQDYMSALPKY